jgi:hypothetical protein
LRFSVFYNRYSAGLLSHQAKLFDQRVESATVTGIEVDFLREEKDLEDACVAKKMSRASKRHTSRVEDMVCCLLGLFDVNMPLLYGGGAKAFMRLQLEVIRKSDDLQGLAVPP